MGSRRPILVWYMAIFRALFAPVTALGTLRNSYILVALGAYRYALALLLTLFDFILCHKLEFC